MSENPVGEDDKMVANVAGKATKESGGKKLLRRKQPTLSQKIEQQTATIESLVAEIRAKDEKLRTLAKNYEALQGIAEKLAEAEKFIHQTKKNESIHSGRAELIEDLSGKLQELEIELVATHLQEQQITARSIVKTNMLAASSFSLLPLPFFDFATLSGVQLNLIRHLSKHYHVEFSEDLAKAVLTSLVSGALPLISVIALSSFIKIIPGLGTIGGSISMGLFSGALVYATGEVFINHFEKGGTLKNFQAKHWKGFFKKEFEKGLSASK